MESLPGGEEIQKLLDDAQADLANIHKAVKAIEEPAVQRDGKALYDTRHANPCLSQGKPEQNQIGAPVL